MVILIEGPDGSGKSTLALWLAKIFRTGVVHGGGPPKSRDDAIQRIQSLLLDARSCEGVRIYDRNTIISEMIYGELRTPLVDVRPFLDEAIRENVLFIQCRPALRTLEDNLILLDREKPHKSTNHVQFVQDHYWQIVERYDEIFALIAKLGGTVLRYAWENPSRYELDPSEEI